MCDPVFWWSGLTVVSNNVNRPPLGLLLSSPLTFISISINQYQSVSISISLRNCQSMPMPIIGIFAPINFKSTQAWIAATSPLLVSILGLNLLPAAFGIMTAGQVRYYYETGWASWLVVTWKMLSTAHQWQCASILISSQLYLASWHQARWGHAFHQQDLLNYVATIHPFGKGTASLISREQEEICFHAH